jgi:hypothetical protein
MSFLRCTALGLAVALVLPACTWVKIEPEAKQIRVVDAGANLSGCGAMLSEITVSVRDRVGFVDRNSLKVRDELETLARNQALGSGADTLRPLSEPTNGEQRFGAWRCGGGTPPRAQGASGQRQQGQFEEVEIIPLDD